MRVLTALFLVTTFLGCSTNSSHTAVGPTSSGVFQPPKMLQVVQPTYPRLQYAAGIEGTANVRALINASGSIDSVLATSETSRAFADQALYAARKNIWQPARLFGKRIKAWATYTVDFKLPYNQK